VSALFLAGSGAANACSCAAFPDEPAEAIAIAYANADVIFTGEAMDIHRNRSRSPAVTDTGFRVDVVWKGKVPDNVIIRSNVGEIACGFQFRTRTSYLVFAYRDPESNTLTTSMCELTRDESKAGDLLAELQAISE
jgi:hypothetical protein